jgi:undecaprenyl-diphosphatase
MALLHIKSTSIDRNVANRMVALARPVPARTEEMLTWGADEHLLLCCAAFAWTAATAYRSPLRPAAAHVLVTAIASAAASHVMKASVDQLRPDRKTLTGHLLGIPLSGDGLDAFPPATRSIWAPWHRQHRSYPDGISCRSGRSH